MRPRLCFAFAVATVVSSLLRGESSQLWGEQGEKWSATGRLPDFSYAGYHAGEQAVPRLREAANVKTFGAVGDGVADDTKAIQAAIDATREGAVFLPAGRYLVSDYLRIEKPGVVLRGAGPEKTILWFPRGLDEVHPREGHDSTGKPTSGYSFDGAFVTIRGDYQAKSLAKVTALARRGDREVEVDSAAGLSVGQRVLLIAHEDRAQSLKTYLYNGDPGDIRRGKQLDTKIVLRVVAIDGRRIRFERPMRFETRAEWQPEVCAFNPTVTESGIEDVGFAFPATRYRGHFKENGANAIELRQVANCWVRHVAITNGDLGINVVACFNTLDGVVISADNRARGTADAGVAACTGHHGIQLKSAEDNFVAHFDFRTSYVHDLSVEHASGNVFAEGRGLDLNFDHHKDTPYENLYSDIDCGAGRRTWRCGGGASIGRQSAGWETFWNIHAAHGLPPAGWGPSTMNFVGVDGARAAKGWWVESTKTLIPGDLHAAQLAQRVDRR